MNIIIYDADPATRARYGRETRLVAAANGFDAVVTLVPTADALLRAADEASVPPDAIFLDVALPEEGGIDLPCTLREHGYAGIIVCLSTTYQEALSAFDAHALNYVVKGEDEGDVRFRHVVLDVYKKVRRGSRPRITLSNAGNHVIIPIGEIHLIEVRNHQCICRYGAVHAEHGLSSFTFVSTLKKVREQLDPYGFVQVHRSFLVNPRYVERWRRYEVLMAGGIRVPVARTHTKELAMAMHGRVHPGVGADAAGELDA